MFKRYAMLAFASALLAAPVRSFGAEAGSDEGLTKVTGVLLKVSTADDGKSAEVKMRVRGKVMTILVKDELTLNKLKVGKIKKGDEIRCQYAEEDGTNVSRSFLRTAGC